MSFVSEVLSAALVNIRILVHIRKQMNRIGCFRILEGIASNEYQSQFRYERMSTGPFTITIHMVSSLDGIIARPDNSVSWFEVIDDYENGVVGQGADEVLKSIDCYVMGANTYEHALELSSSYGWAYGQTPTIVLTHRNLPAYGSTVEMFSGDLTKFVNEQLKPRYRNVWLVGGAMLTREFIRQELADDIRLSILPIILGDGLKFLDQVGKEQVLHVKNVTPYKNGMIELCYGIGKRNQK